MKKILSILLSVVFVAVTSITAFAQAQTAVLDGGFTVTTENPECYTIAEEGNIRDITLKSDADVTFSGDGSSYRIYVPSTSQNVIIRLNNVTMQYTDNGWGACPITLESGAEAAVELMDNTVNTFMGNNEASAIRVPQGASLTITGTGTLNASVCKQSATAASGAVIGSQYAKPYGNIYILGGTLNLDRTANFNDYPVAAIGTAYDNYNEKEESTQPGMIVIGNATVNANGATIGGVMVGYENINNVILYNAAVVNDATIQARIMAEDENGNFTLKDDEFDIVGDFTLEENKTLTIAAGQTLNILPGAKFEVLGKLINNGIINGMMYNTTVKYSVDPAYTVTIPETVNLGDTVEIKAEDVVVDFGSQVEVALAGTSGENNAFQLKSAEGATLNYTVKNGDTEVHVGDTVLTVNPATASAGSTTLSFEKPENARLSGDYAGTLTFSVTVREVNP